MTADIQKLLENNSGDPDTDNGYSLNRFEHFHIRYMQLWLAGKVVPEGSAWHRDNQYSYTMYLTTQHKSDIRLDRASNKGVFNAKYEAAEELEDTSIEI